MNRKKLIISFLAGGLVSALALYVSFRNVPLAGLTEYLARIDYLWYIPTFLILVLGFVFRAIRWRILLFPVARLTFWECFHPMMIGFMMNCILPGRVGELARPVIVNRKHGASFFGVLATVAAERALDLLGLLVFFIAVMRQVGARHAPQVEFSGYVLTQATLDTAVTAMTRLAVVLVLGMVAVSIDPLRRLMAKAIMGAPSVLVFLPAAARKRLREGLSTPIVGIMERVAQGFGLLKSPGRLILCLALTAGVWLVAAYSYVLAAKGSPGIGLGFSQLSAVMVIICFFISLPSAPGFWGLWEAGGIFALALFGVSDTSSAAGYTLAVHVIQMAPAILIGFLSAAVMGVNVMKLTRDEASAPSDPGSQP